MRAGAAAGMLASVETLATPARVLERVLAAPAACGPLSDIEHVVIFINENRSFDSYFGTYRGVRGFHDGKVLKLKDGSEQSIFAQPFPGAAGEPYGGHLLPFHFDTNKGGECVNDISHEWAALHECWNGGALDKFLSVHLETNGLRDGPNTMGYYTREDLPFFHALADAFTICDHYHCSVLGPTDPNRMYTMSATIDPDGQKRRAVAADAGNQPRAAVRQVHLAHVSGAATGCGDQLEDLLDARRGLRRQRAPVLQGLPGKRRNSPRMRSRLNSPSTSWPTVRRGRCRRSLGCWRSLVESEHPPAPVTYGEVALAQVLNALVSNPAVWEKTALFATYDENGGFFDHVPPPVPPPGTPGEYLTVEPLPSIAGGFRGPIGLGFRVPMLVISPFTRGGFVCSRTFDHTSVLRFLERRFGPRCQT